MRPDGVETGEAGSGALWTAAGRLESLSSDGRRSD